MAMTDVAMTDAGMPVGAMVEVVMADRGALPPRPAGAPPGYLWTEETRGADAGWSREGWAR